MHRLSISGCALATSADWAIHRHLPQWRLNRYTTKPVRNAATSQCASVDDDPSPFWISGREVRHLKKVLAHSESMAAPASFRVGGTARQGAERNRHNVNTAVFIRWDTAVNIFGVPYINAADTPLCFMLDSATCQNFKIPLTEAGTVSWPLLRSTGRCLFTSPRSKGEAVAPAFCFHSPYWVEVEGLSERWPGVEMAPIAFPTYMRDGSTGLVNAEQTTDASRFDVLTCGPQRRHECLLTSGVYCASLRLSLRLAEAYAAVGKVVFQKLPASSRAPEVLVPGCAPTVVPQSDSSIGMSSPCNLWVDVALVEAAGWSLHAAAVGMEVQRSELKICGCSHLEERLECGNPVVTLLNAEFIVEREALLNFVTYRPEVVGHVAKIFLLSYTTVRLGLVALTKKYTSTIWIVDFALGQLSGCTFSGDDVVGVEVQLFDCEARRVFTAVVINRDELRVPDEAVMKLRQRHS